MILRSASWRFTLALLLHASGSRHATHSWAAFYGWLFASCFFGLVDHKNDIMQMVATQGPAENRQHTRIDHTSAAFNAAVMVCKAGVFQNLMCCWH